MAAEKYVDDELDLVGKTIAKVVVGSEEVYILFADGTYTGFCAKAIYDGVDIDWREPTGWDLVKLGVITEEAQKAVDAAEGQRAAEQREKARREQYERLKLEFGA